ncbi:ciliogenesis-associated TTC17-interacting protein [Antennarius striatus]|uniref:ciliogenesis-associated TTC17-interacting protein n=1 Tax=Antennarius striatus TaxID=241820 RepID=UPI0035B0C3E1
MDPPRDDATPAGASAEAKGPHHGGQVKASDDVIAFLSDIEPTELQRCVFSESLVTVSEAGRHLGRFRVSVELAHLAGRACVMLRAQSEGAIDDAPCGTTVTAFITTDLQVLEEELHQYVQLEGRRLDRRCHVVQREGQLMVHQVTTVGEDVMEESVSHPASEGLVTEGSSLLLLRLIALRRNLPEPLTFVSLDQGSHLVHVTFRGLGLQQMEVGGHLAEVFGVEKTLHGADGASSWRNYFLLDGHLASRQQVGSPVAMRRMPSPSPRQPEIIPLLWEEDMEMRSNFLGRKAELKTDHASYLRRHPEIRALMSDFLQFLLLRKPDDVYQFAREYFLSFASRRPPETSLTAPPPGTSINPL